MPYKKISDYGIVGNGITLALIGVDGSIDWMCMPYMDSPSIFGALLDDHQGGRFSITPTESWDSVQSYVPLTNILKTSFRTRTGEVELLDFMPAGNDQSNDLLPETMLLRCVKGVKGLMKLKLQCSPRFDYGSQHPSLTSAGPDHFHFRTGRESMTLFSCKPLVLQDEQTIINVNAEDTLWFGIYYGESPFSLTAGQAAACLSGTADFWRKWVRAGETGKYPSHGYWQDNLDRAALVLKLLQMKETGAIAAAASCSLPTIIYGERNWDYRFSWIRDTSMTLSALFELGHTHEVSLYLDWIKNVAEAKGGQGLEVLYKLREAEPPPLEQELTHLSGYKNSRPVRIGQFNVGQHQHDIYGELLETVFALSRLVGKIDPEYWQFIRRLVEHVITLWRKKDNGIWEMRNGPHHMTHSKLMCWVAIDRGIKIAEHYGFPADLDRWKLERKSVKEDILVNGYNRQKKCFTQHYATDAVDASLLLIPLVGFLPVSDKRVADTIRAVERELMIDGIPMRYKADDGLPGQEAGWMICLFWYLRCLILQKRFTEVDQHLRKIDRFANHLGLFGEEYDPRFQEITGNFPQAFSHIGYAITVLEYLNARRRQIPPHPLPVRQKAFLLLRPKTLTPAVKVEGATADGEPGKDLKKTMNIIRGQFYDGHRQRVDYQTIRGTEYYPHFQGAVAGLQYFDPLTLRTDKEKIAFWCNVFNSLVIHAVIELGVKESVREVPFFFERVRYRIGSYRYTLSDIEHGILRGNARPPYRLFSRFYKSDSRRHYCIREPDPRIHFALVCASRTCPPIEAFDASALDEQLDTSASVFINSTTRIDLKADSVAISRIFRWYRKDFKMSDAELLRYLSSYLYDRDFADLLKDRAEDLKIRYTPYDWRLNR